MDNKEQIKARAKERGIEWLVHFTHIENLESILEYGIIPRLQAEQLNKSLGGGIYFSRPISCRWKKCFLLKHYVSQ